VPHIFLLIFALLLFASPATASENPWTHTLYFENDMFTGSDSDYTNGIKYSIISPDLSPDAPRRKTAQIPRKVLDFFHKIPFIKNAAPETSHKVELALAQKMYTPRDISRSDLIRNDRPYAGYTYLATSFHRMSDLGGYLSQMDTAEVQLGIVGPASLAEDAQKLVHRVRGLQRPNGWDNQLKNEPGLALIFERKWLFHPRYDDAWCADAILHSGAALGNVMTYANAGVEIRTGWNLPRSFSVSVIRPAGSVWNAELSGFTVYLFGAIDGRAVARDIFLDGNTFRSSHRVAKEYFVADLSIGLTLSYNRLTVSLIRNTRTREFREQPGSHNFDSVVLSYAF